jgi:hypothetical protein
MTMENQEHADAIIPRIDLNEKASFICPCCTGAGCLGNNGRVEVCEECDGEGRLTDRGNRKKSEPTGKDSALKPPFAEGKKGMRIRPRIKSNVRKEPDLELDR